MCVSQVQKDPIPHAVVDVREKQVVEQQPLPAQLGKVVAIPGMIFSVVTYFYTQNSLALMRSQSSTARTPSSAVVASTCTKWCTLPWGGTHAGLCQ